MSTKEDKESKEQIMIHKEQLEENKKRKLETKKKAD
jgi:hypothetical protein